MIVIIMRHGEAVEYREPDYTRALTVNGKQQCENTGTWLANLLKDTAESVSIALVSPFLRTQQTYRALAKSLVVDNQVTIDTITPSGNAAQCADLIHGYATDIEPPASILVISHMPLVSLLSERLCIDNSACYFEPANALVIDYDVSKAQGNVMAFHQG